MTLAEDGARSRRVYNQFLMLVAGLGGLLYGIDVGIIGGALPYLEATSGLTAAQLSIIVAAVLLGSVISTLFAGILVDWLGRKPLMILSGASFIVSIPMIALSHGYGPLFLGRLLQGVSGGLVGVVIPLYLAECLSASNRGKGTGFFQWLLTLGYVAAAVAGIFFSYRVAAVAAASSAATIFAEHLLGFTPARRTVRGGQPVCERVSPLAFQEGEERTRVCCSASFPERGTGRS
jgi:MFS family permease